MAKKVNKWVKGFLSKQGFTLVELIIVIAIIAVLAIAAFMMLTKWLSSSRDSRRIADLDTVKKAITINMLDPESTGLYPMPDPDADLGGVVATGTIDGVVLTHRGVVGDGVVGSMDTLVKAPKDPSDNSKYILYGITADRKEYQVGVRLEKDQAMFFEPAVFAAESEPFVDGEYDGLIVYPSPDGTSTYVANIPSLLYTFSGDTGTGIDLLAQKADIYPVVNGGDNLPYPIDGETLQDIQKDNSDAVVKKLYGDTAEVIGVDITGMLEGTEEFDDIFTGSTLVSFGGVDNKSVLATTIEDKSGTPVTYTPPAEPEPETPAEPTASELCTLTATTGPQLDNDPSGNCVLQ